MLVLAAGSVSCGSGSGVKVTHDLTLTSDQGAELRADLYRPTGRDAGSSLAAVVLVHGGGWTGGDKHDLDDIGRAMAQAGFAALSVNYDLDGPDRYPHQQEDVQQWVRYLQQRGTDLGVDPSRVALLGVSAGGTLALMVGVLGSGDATLPPVRAVAAWSPVTDFSVLAPPDGDSHPAHPPAGCMGQTACIGVGLPSAFTDYLGCTLAACPNRYGEASPVNRATAAAAPSYLAASADDFVPYDQCQRMAGALQLLGIDAQLQQVPGNGHAESLAPATLTPTIDFLRAHTS